MSSSALSIVNRPTGRRSAGVPGRHRPESPRDPLLVPNGTRGDQLLVEPCNAGVPGQSTCRLEAPERLTIGEPMPTTPTFAIVGAGLAGAKAAETLRAEGFDGRLVLLGEEADRPYDRPPLSKTYLRGEADQDLRSTSTTRASTPPTGSSCTPRPGSAPSTRQANRQLQLASGERIRYQRLLLATGARPRRLRLPGADLDGICYLRNRRDADRLAAAVEHAERVVVVGTGWIGCEVAASVRQLGRDVTLVGPEDGTAGSGARPRDRVLLPRPPCRAGRPARARDGRRRLPGRRSRRSRRHQRREDAPLRPGADRHRCRSRGPSWPRRPGSPLGTACWWTSGWRPSRPASTPPATSPPPGTRS